MVTGLVEGARAEIGVVAVLFVRDDLARVRGVWHTITTHIYWF